MHIFVLRAIKNTCLLIVAAVFIFAGYPGHVQAQSVSPAAGVKAPEAVDSSFEDEFAAFKKKLESAKSVDGDKKGNEASSPDAAIGAATAKALPSSNPLGPAANLPVDKNAPVAAVFAPATPEDVQAEMDAETQRQQKELEEKAFNGALKQLLPLTPDQIRRVYDAFKDSRRAAETPVAVPEPRQSVMTVSLDPMQAPPVIHVAPGYVTTVSILDSSGAPWPVQDINYAGKYTVTPPESGGNVIRLFADSSHGAGNLSIRLVDLITPIVITLSTDIDMVDYRIDMRIPKNGPLAKTPLIEFGGLTTTAGADSNLSAMLEGAIPASAEKLSVKGVDARTAAWRVDGRIYLRTPLSLLSPAWDSSAASADGTTVYTLNNTPVVILSDDGRMVQAQITDTDEVKP